MQFCRNLSKRRNSETAIYLLIVVLRMEKKPNIPQSSMITYHADLVHQASPQAMSELVK